ncbi:XapX domain-containing protein [Halalkalibacter kiskunsagensis]|uniref:XapX domain-containing protein n=1 Tax=Halalkalibacter kiskunsagensis TaxID=1548599 RepID=A0ABV6KC08_9BACI
MKELLLSVLAGIIIGVTFKFLRLPLPAPPVLAGILGIFGVYLGGMIASSVFKL